MNSKSGKLAVLAAVILLCSCAPALYIPSVVDASRTGFSAESLIIGRTLYTNHCGSCHNLHLPEQYTTKHWLQQMPEMQQKAKISDEEARLITNFLLVRSKAE
jgi:cytochrome c5